jgi:hypothetical protein
VDVDVSRTPYFSFPTHTDYKVRARIYTLPFSVVYPTIISKAQELAMQIESTLASLNFLVGMAARTVEDGHFGPEYKMLTSPDEPVSFKLEGGRGRTPMWLAFVGFPESCYANTRQSLQSQMRMYHVLSREGTQPVG